MAERTQRVWENSTIPSWNALKKTCNSEGSKGKRNGVPSYSLGLQRHRQRPKRYLRKIIKNGDEHP